MKDQAWLKETFERLRLLMNEMLCRLWAASEARALGFGGVTAVSAATGLSHNCIREGVKELERLGEYLQSAIPHEKAGSGPRRRNPLNRVRRPGGGRKLSEVKDPGIVAALERLLADEVAGDPMSEQRWIRSSLRRLSTKLKEEGHQASTGTVRRLLKCMGFSLKVRARPITSIFGQKQTAPACGSLEPTGGRRCCFVR